jgi:hypothetical protein
LLYQLYLLDGQGVRRAKETYTALDDDDALEIGFGVYHAISEHFVSYEVWQGNRRIRDDVRQQPRGMTVEEVMTQRVGNMLELEERLSLSHDVIKRTQKLLETMNVLQTWRNRRPN